MNGVWNFGAKYTENCRLSVNLLGSTQRDVANGAVCVMGRRISDPCGKFEQYCIRNAKYAKAITLRTGSVAIGNDRVAISLGGYIDSRNHKLANLNDLDVRLRSHKKEQTTGNVKIDE